jgi:acyl-CoA synthetase (AMP-forming)/AMP-acid ligase II
VTGHITQPLYPTLGAALADQAKRKGEAIALVCGSRRTSFSQLNRQADLIAGALRQARCGKGAIVGILARNSDFYVQVIFGAARAGALLLTMNWRLARPELEIIAADTNLRILFFDPAFADEARNLQRRRPKLILVCLGEQEGNTRLDEFMQTGDDSAFDSVDIHDPAFVLYTSGATGQPKGIVLSHFGTLHNLTQSFATKQPTSPRPDDVVLLSPPMFHISGLLILIGAVMFGAQTIILGDAKMPNMIAAISEHGVTRAVIIPVLMPQLIDAAAAGAKIDSLKTILYGMSPMPEDTLSRTMQLLDCVFVQQLGLTEASGSLTQLDPGDHYPGSPRLTSCGRRLPDIELSIRLSDGAEAGTGEHGELFFRSPSLAAGTLQAGKLTPMSTDGGWAATGDVGYLDADGYVYLCDRKKDMIVTGGENVYSSEVERVIRQYPDVEMVAVIGVPSERWGEEVKAVVVPRAGSAPSVHDILGYVRKSLAGYKVPKTIDFVEALPVTSVGKIAKNVLREQYWRGYERRIN